MNISLKKVILVILCGIVVLTTVSALIQSRRGKNLPQEVADIRRSLREQGFKTELADFTVTTDDATRARAAAVTFLKSGLDLDADGDQLDFLPRVTDDTANVLWKQDSLTFEHRLLQWSDLRSVFETNRDALDAACAAALAGPIRFDLDFTDSGSRWNEHESALRNLSFALGDRIILELHERNLDAAWTNLLAATRLVTAWDPEPTGLSHLIHSVSTEIAFRDGWQALQNGHWPDKKLSVLQQEWESANFFTNVPEVTALDRVSDVNYSRKLSRRPAFAELSFSRFAGRAIEHPSAAFSEIKDEFDTMRYRTYEALNDEKNLLLILRDRELEARHAIQSPTWAEMRVQPGVTNVTAFNSVSRELMVRENSNQRFMYMVDALRPTPRRSGESSSRPSRSNAIAENMAHIRPRSPRSRRNL